MQCVDFEKKRRITDKAKACQNIFLKYNVNIWTRRWCTKANGRQQTLGATWCTAVWSNASCRARAQKCTGVHWVAPLTDASSWIISSGNRATSEMSVGAQTVYNDTAISSGVQWRTQSESETNATTAPSGISNNFPFKLLQSANPGFSLAWDVDAYIYWTTTFWTVTESIFIACQNPLLIWISLFINLGTEGNINHSIKVRRGCIN